MSLNCEIDDSWSGPSMQKGKHLKNLLLYSHTWEKKIKQMHDYDVHATLFLSCEIHGPWVRGSTNMVTLSNVLNLTNIKNCIPLYI